MKLRVRGRILTTDELHSLYEKQGTRWAKLPYTRKLEIWLDMLKFAEWWQSEGLKPTAKAGGMQRTVKPRKTGEKNAYV